MGYKYTGDSVLGLSLTVNAPKPLDSRTVVDNLQQLYDIPSATAYQGMTVANIANGNIYMLVDKSKMNEKAGWKASYESIQIITCTEAEYNIWKENTNDDFTPINGDLTYLHPDTYYYIYEDSIENKGVYYVSSEEFEKLQDQVNLKASNSGLEDLAARFGEFKLNVTNTYITTESAANIYATKEEVSSNITTSLENYYTKEVIDNDFVTKASLRGGIEGDSDDFVFVTQAKYSEDKDDIWEELNKTIKTDTEGQLESLSVNSLITGEIKSPAIEGEEQLSVQITKEGLLIGEDLLAKQSEIPNIVTLTLKDYEDKEKANELDPDTYYCIYDTEDDQTYVTKSYLTEDYTRSITVSILDEVAGNYDNSNTIKKLLEGYQPKGEYATSEQVKNCYTKEESNSKFQTIEFSDSNYATKSELETFSEQVASDYVRIDWLKEDGSDDTDFKFVTQNEYNSDKNNLAISFNTQDLTAQDAYICQLNIQKLEEKEIEQINPETGESTTITELETVSNVTLSSDQDQLLVNGNIAALSKDVPKIEYISKADYDAIPKEEIKTDTYYFLYDPDDNFENGFVTGQYLNENFYNKNQIEEYINTLIKNSLKPLLERIAVLEANASSLDQGRLNKLKLG